MKRITIFFLKIYKLFISPALAYLFGKGCRFVPTCSDYAMESIKKYGVIKGGELSLKRISKCHPFNHSPYLDPVPNL